MDGLDPAQDTISLKVIPSQYSLLIFATWCWILMYKGGYPIYYLHLNIWREFWGETQTRRVNIQRWAQHSFLAKISWLTNLSTPNKTLLRLLIVVLHFSIMSITSSLNILIWYEYYQLWSINSRYFHIGLTQGAGSDQSQYWSHLYQLTWPDNHQTDKHQTVGCFTLFAV